MKEAVPNFPLLFKTIGDFLVKAHVAADQVDDLKAAREAFDTIARTVYSGQAAAYPCTRRTLIPPMPVAPFRPCLIRGTLVPPLAPSRSRK